MDNKDQIIKKLKEEIEALKEELRHTKRYKEAIETAGFDIFENNFVTGETFGTNYRLFKSLGYNDDEIPQDVSHTFNMAHQGDMAKALEKVAANIAGETDRYHADMRLKAKDGSMVWISNYGGVYERDENGAVTRFIGVTFNIDQKRIKEEAIKEMAFKDSLTGLGNRRLLMEAGQQEVERSKRYNHPLSLVMLDIDDFKEVNDSFGHLSGDIVIQKIASLIKNVVRETDLKIRYGGDEFVLILTETSQEMAYETVERLRKNISKHDFLINRDITISTGLTTLEDKDTIETMLSKADKALYQAKNAGKNQTIIFNTIK